MHKDAFSLTYINLPSDHQSAISKVDETVVRAAVPKCLDEERVGPVHDLGLSSCGLYVATKLQRFKQMIAEYSRAKPMLSAIVLGRMPCVPAVISWRSKVSFIAQFTRKPAPQGHHCRFRELRFQLLNFLL